MEDYISIKILDGHTQFKQDILSEFERKNKGYSLDRSFFEVGGQVFLYRKFKTIKKLPKTYVVFDKTRNGFQFKVDGVFTKNAGFVDKINELVDAVNLINKKLKK